MSLGDDRSQHIDTGGGDIGNVVGPGASVGGHVISEKHPEPQAPRSKTGSAVVTYSSLTLAMVVLVGFVVLGVAGTLEWKYALPAALGGGVIIGAGGMLAGHLRG